MGRYDEEQFRGIWMGVEHEIDGWWSVGTAVKRNQ